MNCSMWNLVWHSERQKEIKSKSKVFGRKKEEVTEELREFYKDQITV